MTLTEKGPRITSTTIGIFKPRIDNGPPDPSHCPYCLNPWDKSTLKILSSKTNTLYSPGYSSVWAASSCRASLQPESSNFQTTGHAQWVSHRINLAGCKHNWKYQRALHIMMIIISEVLLHEALVSACIGVQHNKVYLSVSHGHKGLNTSAVRTWQVHQRAKKVFRIVKKQPQSLRKKMINEYLAYFCSLIIQAL